MTVGSARGTDRPQQGRCVAVLGGGGFLGSHLVHALLERSEHRVLVVDRALDKIVDRPGPRLELRQAALQDAGVVDEVLERCEVVFSLTALCNPSLYNTRPLEVIRASYGDLVPVVEGCAARGRWLIHCSTCEVYGRVSADQGPLAEDEALLALGPVHRQRWTYACAKQLLERLIWAHGAHGGLPFTIVRPFNVIGPRMDYIAGVDGEGVPRVLACFMRALLAGEPLPLVEGGAQRRSFVSVRELCEALLRIVERPACRGAILNVGNPDNDVSIAELAARLEACYARRCGASTAGTVNVTAAAFYGDGYDDAQARVPDIGKLERLLEWRPRIALQEMLPEIVDDYVARYAGRVPRGAGARGG